MDYSQGRCKSQPVLVQSNNHVFELRMYASPGRRLMCPEFGFHFQSSIDNHTARSWCQVWMHGSFCWYGSYKRMEVISVWKLEGFKMLEFIKKNKILKSNLFSKKILFFVYVFCIVFCLFILYCFLSIYFIICLY